MACLDVSALSIIIHGTNNIAFDIQVRGLDKRLYWECYLYRTNLDIRINQGS